MNPTAIPPVTVAAVDADGHDIRVLIGGPERIVNASDTPAVREPLVRAAYPVKPDVLALTIHAQAVIPGVIQPYARQADDQIALSGYRIPMNLAEATGVKEFVTPEMEAKGEVAVFSVVLRGGNPVGYRIGPKQDQLWPFDQLVGAPLDEEWAMNPASYSISSNDDPAFRRMLNPTQVHRKTRPFRRVRTPNPKDVEWAYCLTRHTHTHEIYLCLPKRLISGKTYTIHFASQPGKLGTQLADITLTFDDRKTVSEAVQVNQHGYQVESPKLAFLSTWMGDGGEVSYPDANQFQIIDESGKAVLAGTPALRAAHGQVEFYQDAEDGGKTPISNSKTSVYALDFSELKMPGRYRVRIPGIGASMPFAVTADRWESAFKVGMKGYYHQRSGIELGPPYSTFVRPRDFHSDDGNKTYVCDDDLFFNTPGDHSFKRIQESICMDRTEPGAFGGWHDAADFDRSILYGMHLWPVNCMIDLLTINPGYFEKLSLNIPESGNGIPDILNEALWCADLFLRIQRPDGGVPFQVESIEHPKAGETSWLNSLPTAITPPIPESAWQFAGTAAHLALALEKYDGEKAACYRSAALHAAAWAETRPDVPVFFLKAPHAFQAVKNFAFAALYNLTGEEKWERLFAETMPGAISGIALAPNHWSDVFFLDLDLIGPYLYAASPRPTHAGLKAKAKELVLKFAETLLDRQAKTATYSIIENGKAHGCSHSFSPLGLGYAAILSGDHRYLDAIARGAHYAMGANPMNISFMKGIGSRQVRPQYKDGPYRGLDVPDGIPAFFGVSPSNQHATTQCGEIIRAAGVYPALESWPGTESYFDDIAAQLNEFTVTWPMADMIFGWGLLAAIASNSSQGR